MRAGDVDAALYYMARMIDSGEDPKFIARRMVIFASEDIGMADSSALTVANDVFRAIETIGLPECQFNLAHGVTYLACAPKNRAAGKAYFTALDDVKELGNLPRPAAYPQRANTIDARAWLRRRLSSLYRRKHAAGSDQRQALLPAKALASNLFARGKRGSMPKLNVLLITSDQQHWNTLGQNNPEIQTPALDKLATQGATFTRAYCPNPTCTPTRSSMITGKYPSQHGAYSLGAKLPESEPTIGDTLHAAGYRTALVGKAHFQPLQSTAEYPSLESYPILQDLDFWGDFDGPFYGFDHIELARNHTDESHVGQHYALWMEEKGLHNWRDYYLQPTGHVESQRRKWLIPERFHYNAWIAERSSALISQYHEQDQPFFLWASFFDPHPKYLAPEPWDTMYDPADLSVPSVTPGEHDANPPHLQLTQTADPDFSSLARTQWQRLPRLPFSPARSR